jgi:WD40 repeat protein
MLASASADMTIRVWDSATWGLTRSILEGHSDTIMDVTWTPDSTQLLSTSLDQTTRLWDVSGTSEVMSTFSPPFEHVLWSQNGTYVMGGSENRIDIWNKDTGQVVDVLSGQLDPSSTTVWSPGRALLATVNADNVIEIWQQDRTLQLVGHTDTILSLSWSPDGARLVSTSLDNSVRIWNTASGSLISTTESLAPIQQVAWTPDGQYLALAGHDHTINIWNADTQQLVITLQGHLDSVTDVAWSPDGTQLASSSHDGTIRIWQPVPIEQPNP